MFMFLMFLKFLKSVYKSNLTRIVMFLSKVFKIVLLSRHHLNIVYTFCCIIIVTENIIIIIISTVRPIYLPQSARTTINQVGVA